jgi:exodeoxyribonuclease VII large subunit
MSPKSKGDGGDQLSFESRLTVPPAAVAPRTAVPPEPTSAELPTVARSADSPPAAKLATAVDAAPRIWLVSELLRAARLTLESRFADVRVEGEVSGLKRSSQGHLYFCLKDAQGLLDCVLYAREAARLKFQLDEGMAVRCRGRLTLYEARGRFQMTVAEIEPTGAGALALAFEQLKQKLSAEGLFDTARKRPLPFFPRRIGVVTSATGAVIRDIVRVAHRRCAVRILLAPTPVQGEGASLAIAAALRRLEAVADVDVIIVARGGGSLEDLWAFNEEPVARAIFACRVPVISAVGHETDFTIADFVADLRAPTPSAAAERAVPMLAELRAELAVICRRAGRATAEHVRARRHALERARARLGDPRRLLDERRQTLDDAAERARRQLGRQLAAARAGLRALETRLYRAHPQRRVSERRNALAVLRHRLEAAPRAELARRRHAIDAARGKLGALSPLNVLERGFSLAQLADGRLLTRAEDARPGDALRVRLRSGEIHAEVRAAPDAASGAAPDAAPPRKARP